MADESRATLVFGEALVQPGAAETRATLVFAEALVKPGASESRATLVFAETLATVVRHSKKGIVIVMGD